MCSSQGAACGLLLTLSSACSSKVLPHSRIRCKVQMEQRVEFWCSTRNWSSLYLSSYLLHTARPSHPRLLTASVFPAAARCQHRKLKTHGARLPYRRPEQQPCSILTSLVTRIYRKSSFQLCKIVLDAFQVIRCNVFCWSVPIKHLRYP